MTRTFKLSSVSSQLVSASAALLVTAAAFTSAAVLTVTGPHPETEVIQLERVVVVGQRTEVAQLPRVVVVGQRSSEGQQVAAACATTAVC